MPRPSRFPGYAPCLALMRKRSASDQEGGFRLLLPHAQEHVEELMRDFHAERDHRMRCWLLELIGVARSPEALSLLVDQLDSPSDSLREWAVRGLVILDTAEARRALFDSGFSKRAAEIRKESGLPVASLGVRD